VAFVLLLPLVLLVTGVVSELSWQLVEKPALRLRGRRVRQTPQVAPDLAPAGGHAG
jgi:peptidoglycan/LPS O-acetylase OafA/YrhL